ncbi:P-loop containing nucleoside triphosphate hydrolase protein [Entophlyctis helioformis]|nr:P-loop containing nucleoside triphosphate hydrolase protein [Entophlyctis helioformis]
MVLALRSSLALSLSIVCVFPLVGAVLGVMHHQSTLNDAKMRSANVRAMAVSAQALRDSESERFEAAVEGSATVQRWVSIVNGSGGVGYSATMFMAFAVSFAVGGWLVAAGHISPGDVLNSFTQIAVASRRLETWVKRVESRARLDVLKTLASHIADLECLSAPLEDLIEPPSFSGKLEFCNVWFRYPTRHDTWILQDFSLVIDAGQHVALVGESGCGKSTLFHLVTRLYEVESGTILLDGSILPASAQHSDLFDGTVRANVAMGSHQHESTDRVPEADIERVCSIAQASPFIAGLDCGHDTLLTGSMVALSGGQVQRIAIARALLGASALDPRTERLVLSSIISSRPNQTALFISHRVASLHAFSRIVVLKGGRVVETHDGIRVPYLLVGYLGAHSRGCNSHSRLHYW